MYHEKEDKILNQIYTRQIFPIQQKIFFEFND